MDLYHKMDSSIHAQWMEYDMSVVKRLYRDMQFAYLDYIESTHKMSWSNGASCPSVTDICGMGSYDTINMVEYSGRIVIHEYRQPSFIIDIYKIRMGHRDADDLISFIQRWYRVKLVKRFIYHKVHYNLWKKPLVEEGYDYY